MPKFENVKEDDWYRIVVPNFIYKGGNGINTFANKHRNHETGPIDIDVFVSYVKAITPFEYKLDGRMTILS